MGSGPDRLSVASSGRAWGRVPGGGQFFLQARKKFPALRDFAWQDGYGVFCVSKSQEEAVKR